ncbi:hypothetical protein VTK56DRAFT_2105 [Thermocarpiscus australiensis]
MSPHPWPQIVLPILQLATGPYVTLLDPKKLKRVGGWRFGSPKEYGKDRDNYLESTSWRKLAFFRRWTMKDWYTSGPMASRSC